MQTESLRSLRQGSFLIAQIFQLSGRIFARKMRKADLSGITPEQGRILFALWQGDDVSIQELSKRTMLSKSTLTAMLDRLESSGHIVRVPSREDRRRIMIRLTEKDRQLQSVYLRLSEEMAQITYRGFGETEIDAFEKALKMILDNLKESEKKEKKT